MRSLINIKFALAKLAKFLVSEATIIIFSYTIISRKVLMNSSANFTISLPLISNNNEIGIKLLLLSSLQFV